MRLPLLKKVAPLLLLACALGMGGLGPTLVAMADQAEAAQTCCDHGEQEQDSPPVTCPDPGCSCLFCFTLMLPPLSGMPLAAAIGSLPFPGVLLRAPGGFPGAIDYPPEQT